MIYATAQFFDGAGAKYIMLMPRPPPAAILAPSAFLLRSRISRESAARRRLRQSAAPAFFPAASATACRMPRPCSPCGRHAVARPLRCRFSPGLPLRDRDKRSAWRRQIERYAAAFAYAAMPRHYVARCRALRARSFAMMPPDDEAFAYAPLL